MTDEEYLRACGGWTCDYGHLYLWSHERHGSGLTIAAAVEAQLADDRARMAFVLARTPQPEPLDFVVVPDVPVITTPEDAQRLFGMPVYASGGAPSNASAAAVEALKMQRPVVAVKVDAKPQLLAADRVGYNVAAQRNGVLTVRLDDGREYPIAVVAGDTVRMIGTAVEATLRSAYGVER